MFLITRLYCYNYSLHWMLVKHLLHLLLFFFILPCSSKSTSLLVGANNLYSIRALWKKGLVYKTNIAMPFKVRTRRNNRKMLWDKQRCYTLRKEGKTLINWLIVNYTPSIPTSHSSMPEWNTYNYKYIHKIQWVKHIATTTSLSTYTKHTLHKTSI